MKEETEALHRFVLSWADDKYVFGHQLASITGFYAPDLEENLALGSLAQDHLGHARILYQQITSTDREVDQLVFLRLPAEYRCSLLAGAWQERNWAFLVVKGFLYAHAELLRAGAIANTGQSIWCDLGQVVVRDERVHLDHWRQWMFTLAQKSAGIARLQPALDQLWPLGGEFFNEPLYHGATTLTHATMPTNAELLHTWVERAGSELHALELNIPLTTAQQLTAQAESLERLGLCGRQGQHALELRTMLSDAHAIYQSDPTVIWG